MDSNTETNLWQNSKAKRSQAVPDRSLFGTTAELKAATDDDKLKEISPKRDFVLLVSKPPKRPRPQLNLPPSLQNRNPGEFTLNRQRNAVSITKDEQERATSLLNFLETQSRYYNLQIKPMQRSHTAKTRSVLSHKHTADALLYAAEMNAVGINHHNYNRDKYQRPRESHSYSFIGPSISKGMEFNTQLKSFTQPKLPEVSAAPRRFRLYRSRSAYTVQQSSGIEDRRGIDHMNALPKNILHSVGLRRFNELHASRNDRYN